MKKIFALIMALLLVLPLITACHGTKEIKTFFIPETFDDVYNNYNQIQTEQGFNLEKYAGQRVKRWTYVIRNYPDTSPTDDFIRINILVSDDIVIGGDVCSVKLDGFMHGFSKE